jgi:hypothetical protein
MFKDLIARYHSYRATLDRYRGALRRLRPATLDRDADRRFDTLTAHSEALLRLPTEHDRIRQEIRDEEEMGRRLAAAVARYEAYGVRRFVNEAREAIERTRRHTALSFPDALDGVDANGMIMLAVLRAQLQPLMSSMDAATLLNVYQAALQRKDARGLAEAEIIESLARSGAPLSKSDADLPIVRQLRQHVEDIADLRLPLDLPDFEKLLTDVDRLDSRADVISLLPLTSDEAKTAYETQLEAMTTAGKQNDAQDQAALREELAAS